MDYRRGLLVAWYTVSRPKEEGGLGLRDQVIWNQAMVVKLVNWIAEKKCSVWVKWVHQIYIKGKTWMDYSPNNESSWTWRKICKTREDLTDGYTNERWSIDNEGYIAKGCYSWMRGQLPKVRLAKMVWNSWSLPKHSIFTWLILNESLKTKSKLKRIGVCDEALCCLYAQEKEMREHLFSRCTHSRRIIDETNKTRLSMPWDKSLDWGMGKRGTKLQRRIQVIVTMVGLYHIWHQRNRA
ncbi:uncharacterized protein LOC141590149 [Silene latifolia]|uniref:uncharacterized protein LOC141590149 n=1 Tax=Silene latifolia TaxID=37657 RepID=UPI003D77C568